MHGIGGAKYDRVTDRLIETFFGLAPPSIMVLSATLHLPVCGAAVPAACAGKTSAPQGYNSSHSAPRTERAENLRDIRRELRGLSHHPETYLHANQLLDGEATHGAGALVNEKQRWIVTPVTPENAYTRWNSLRRINNELQPWVAQQRQQLLELQSQMQRELRHEKVLSSREYGFCLYPESYLKDFLQRATSQERVKML